jgi:Kef-type K+ transport system membrane component KefB
LWAAEAPGERVPDLLLALAAILLVARLFAGLAEWLGQASVLGELVAGVVLGSSGLNLIPHPPALGGEIIAVLAEIGVLLLLLEVGLEIELKDLLKVGGAATAVAAVGVVVPFLLGYGFWSYWPHGLSAGDIRTVAIFVGATLTATSVGITARILGDLRQMHSAEARIVLGAAVIDDIVGLVILTVVSALAAGTGVSLLGIGKTAALAVGFLVLAVVGGRLAAPRVFQVVDRAGVRHTLVAITLAVTLGLAALAEQAGSAAILGAFAAGLILAGTPRREAIQAEIHPLTAALAPIFFVEVGAAVDFHRFSPAQAGGFGPLGVALGLTLLAIAGKLVAGWAAPWQPFRRLAVGIGMVPRGEVGLIFASLGLSSGVLNESSFGAIVLMVMATTFAAPVGLRWAFRTAAGAPPA